MSLPQPIDIVLVTWNRPDITDKMLQGLKKNTKRENYRLILVDNGSEDPTRRVIEKYLDIIDDLVACNMNYGLEPARNAGLERVKNEDYFICADNDCIPRPMRKDALMADGVPVIGSEKEFDWIEDLASLMVRHPDYAAISCRTQVMIGTGNIFEEADENGEELVDFPHPGGSLRIMRTGAVRDAGGWRNEVDGRGTEERYICGKLREAGFKTGFATHIPTLHLFGDRTKGTDRWGYPEDWKPEDTGHSDIWHPALANGDDPEEVAKWIGQS